MMTFLRLRQTIYGRVKECHEEGSNTRELADQPRDLTTKPTVLDRRCELLQFVNFEFKNGCKNEFEDDNEKS